MTMRQLAQSRDARVYLVGQSFSLFGDTAMFLALGIWVKELTHSNADAGLTFLFFPLFGFEVTYYPIVYDLKASPYGAVSQTPGKRHCIRARR